MPWRPERTFIDVLKSKPLQQCWSRQVDQQHWCQRTSIVSSEKLRETLWPLIQTWTWGQTEDKELVCSLRINEAGQGLRSSSLTHSWNETESLLLHDHQTSDVTKTKKNKKNKTEENSSWLKIPADEASLRLVRLKPDQFTAVMQLQLLHT